MIHGTVRGPLGNIRGNLVAAALWDLFKLVVQTTVPAIVSIGDFSIPPRAYVFGASLAIVVSTAIVMPLLKRGLLMTTYGHGPAVQQGFTLRFWFWLLVYSLALAAVFYFLQIKLGYPR